MPPGRHGLNYQRYLTFIAHGFPCFTVPLGYPGDYDHFPELGYAVGDILLVPRDEPDASIYLFNIFDTKGNSRQFNAHKDFEPAARPNIQQHKEYFKSNTWFLSQNVRRLNPDDPSVLHAFSSTGSGAVLGILDDAIRKDLEISSHDYLKDYIRIHAKEWYNLALEIEKVHNGSLFLVTGLDTSQDYCCGSLAANTPSEELGFKLYPGEPSAKYRSIRWGNLAKIESTMEPFKTHTFRTFTKTLFFRGFSIALHPQDFNDILDARGESEQTPDTPIPYVMGETSLLYRFAMWAFKKPRPGIWIPPLSVYRPHLDTTLPYHLSNTLLQRLLQFIPKGSIAVIHDDEWQRVVKQMDQYEVHKLIEGDWNMFADEILRHYIVVSDNGIVSLKPLPPEGVSSGRLIMWEYLAYSTTATEAGYSKLSALKRKRTVVHLLSSLPKSEIV